MKYAINEQIYFDFKIQLAKDTRSYLTQLTTTEWNKWFRIAQGKPVGRCFRRKMKRCGRGRP